MKYFDIVNPGTKIVREGITHIAKKYSLDMVSKVNICSICSLERCCWGGTPCLGVYYVRADKIDPLCTTDQIIPLRDKVYGRDTHAALMKAHYKRENYGKYNEYGNLANKVIRGLIGPERTDLAQEEPPKEK